MLYQALSVRLERSNTGELCWDDQALDNEYHVYVSEEVPEHQVADAALDIFHSSIAVNILDDFEFQVLKEGVVLETSEDHQVYSLEDKGYIA